MRPERPLAPDAAARLELLVARRAARAPMAQILGRREFWSLDFTVTADTLTPRPESEEIVAAVLEALPARDAPLRILDLGCGTGCLLLAILSERPRATGLGIDISAPALDVAGRNAAALGFADRAVFAIGDWGASLSGTFDAIVSNPPYIASGEIAALAPEVARYEPRLALDGGVDGLDAYRRLAPDVERLIAASGVVALEVGAGQADDVSAIMGAAGLAFGGGRSDLAGHRRCVVFARNSLGKQAKKA